MERHEWLSPVVSQDFVGVASYRAWLFRRVGHSGCTAAEQGCLEEPTPAHVLPFRSALLPVSLAEDRQQRVNKCPLSKHLFAEALTAPVVTFALEGLSTHVSTPSSNFWAPVFWRDFRGSLAFPDSSVVFHL